MIYEDLFREIPYSKKFVSSYEYLNNYYNDIPNIFKNINGDDRLLLNNELSVAYLYGNVRIPVGGLGSPNLFTPVLHDLVKKNMIHNCTISRCKKGNPNASCKYGFPKQPCSSIHEDEDGHLYLPRNSDDNRVVEYSPYFLLYWKGHCHVHILRTKTHPKCSERAIHYIVKYNFKSEPSLRVQVSENGRDYNTAFHGRIISVEKAVTKIFGYHFFGKDITTFYLPLKSPENRMAAFANERQVQITAVEKYFQRPRELERMGILSFFSQYDVIATSLSNRMIEINDERPHRLRPPNTLVKGSHWEEINFGQPNLIEKGYLFPSEQLPEAKSLICKRRSNPQIVITERFNCSSNMEDFYYTYLLLSGSWRSDEEMKANKDSWAKALEFHGISIPDDDQLLHYYKLLIKYMIASPRYNDYEITRYISLMNYDMKPYLRSLKDDYDINIQNRIDSLVNQIEIIDNAWSSDYIPSILDPSNSHIINQYINYKFTDAQIQEANDCLLNNINSLNREQHYIYDQIISRLENLQQVCAFIQGKAGTGKSFLINILIKFLISKSIPYIVYASTGIAASLIGGSTVHSAFGIYSKK